jgi:hypothetical protein
VTSRPTMTVARYVAALSPDRRAIVVALRQLLRRHRRLREEMAVNPTGDIVMYRDGDRFAFGLADRKDGVGLYALGLPRIRPVLEEYGPRFGRLLVGVYCVRFRHLDELDAPLLGNFIRDLLAIPEVAKPASTPDRKRRAPRSGASRKS